MSFILDALKKSEAERQRQAGPTLLATRIARPKRTVPVWLIVAMGLLVIVNLVGLLWFWLRPAPDVTAGRTGPAAASVVAAAPPSPTVASPPLATAANATAPESLEPPAASLPESAVIDDAEDEERAGNLPSYGSQGATVPPLRLDLHVYSTSSAERYAMINMRKVKEGDTTDDGVKVLEITRGGVVVLYRGEESLLER